MPERLTPRQFQESDGVDDWREVGIGACASFCTGSLPCSATQEVGDEDLLDPRRRGPSIWFQPMDAPRPQRNRLHVDVFVPCDAAEARVAAALTAGGRLVDDSHAPRWWTLADTEGNEVDVATTYGRE